MRFSLRQSRSKMQLTFDSTLPLKRAISSPQMELPNPTTNVIHRAFRVAMATEPAASQPSQDSFDALLSKMGSSRPAHDDKSQLPPPPTPPPAHLGDVSPHPAHNMAPEHSLTAFGSLLESPVKGGFAGDSQDSMVGRAVDALMSESSADYCRKFADLADRIASADA